MNHTLSVSHLCWHIDDRALLDDISFTVNHGEFVGVIGANGSGKTSLLRTLYRYITPTSGEIRLMGKDIANQSLKQIARQVAVVTQSNQALPYTVKDIVAMGLTPHKRLFEQQHNQDLEKIRSALASVELLTFEQTPFQQLSGGEQQRVLIARAIVQGGDLLILDEPTNHLDIHYQIDILSRVKSLGSTVIASLHDLNIASAFCDKILLIDQGKLVCQGTPAQVLTKENIKRYYQVDASISPNPCHGKPHISFHYQAQSCQE